MLFCLKREGKIPWSRPTNREEDKDTQREKVKDRRRRLERPGSFQLNKVSRKTD